MNSCCLRPRKRRREQRFSKNWAQFMWLWSNDVKTIYWYSELGCVEQNMWFVLLVQDFPGHGGGGSVGADLVLVSIIHLGVVVVGVLVGVQDRVCRHCLDFTVNEKNTTARSCCFTHNFWIMLTSPPAEFFSTTQKLFIKVSMTVFFIFRSKSLLIKEWKIILKL